MNIAIASGKGGTGKTTLSTSLATFLSQTYEPVLVDLDVEEPNTGLLVRGDEVHAQDMFKLVPEWTGNCSLCGQCRDICNFNAVIQTGSSITILSDLCHSCHACSELCRESALPMVQERIGVLKRFRSAQLHRVESILDVGQDQATPLIAQTKDYVSEHFDDHFIKIYDCPPGTACAVVEAVKGADYVILVTEPTPFGLYDLKLAVELIRKMGLEFGVVVNRSGIGNDDVLKYCRDNWIPILAKIPNDRRIAEYHSEGTLISDGLQFLEGHLGAIENYLDLSVVAGAG